VPFLQLLACIALFIPAKLYVFRAAIPAADRFVSSLSFREKVMLVRALTYEGLALCVACELLFLLTMYVLPRGKITLRRTVAFGWGGVFFLMSFYQLMAFLHWQHFFTYPSWGELTFLSTSGPLVASLGRLLDDRPFATLFVLFALLHSGALVAALKSSKPFSNGEIRAWIGLSAVIAGFALSGWVGPKFPLPWAVTTHPIVALMNSETRLGAPRTMKLMPGPEEPCDPPPASWVTVPPPAPPYPRPTRAQDLPDVVVVYWESVPARAVYPWNPDPNVTPRIAAMKDRLCLLDRFYSNGSLSFPSRFAFLFGQYCPMVVKNWGVRAVPFALPAVFERAGYRTVAIGSNNMEFSGTRQMLLQAGFDRIEDPSGFSEGYLPHVWGVDDRMAFDRLKKSLSEPHAKPMFSLVLTSSSHHPYQYPLPGSPPASLDRHAFYQAAVKFDDGLIADFIDWLDARKNARPILFVVVGDHGEAFDEHPGFVTHGNGLYDEYTHVAAFVAQRQKWGLPERIKSMASLIDLGPTVLELAGQAVPPEYQGRSIAKAPPAGEVYGYLPYMDAKLSLRDERWTLITGLEGVRVELYDALADPEEHRNLADERPALVNCMRRRLAQWLDRQNSMWHSWVN
jgi:lipoteichoic acid synthase